MPVDRQPELRFVAGEIGGQPVTDDPQGLLFTGSAGATGSALPGDATVCSCHNVSKATVVDAITAADCTDDGSMMVGFGASRRSLVVQADSAAITAAVVTARPLMILCLI